MQTQTILSTHLSPSPFYSQEAFRSQNKPKKKNNKKKLAEVETDSDPILLLLLGRFSRVRLCATHRRQAAHQASRPRPWDSPGKNTGVGCHFLVQSMKVKSEK